MLYLRQSKEREDSTSIEDQERLCRGYCLEKGYEVVEVLTDRDTSASEIPWRKRGNFPRVFDLDVDVLVIYRWDRLSRDDFDQVEILKKWGALQREVEAQAEPIDTSTASGMLHRSMVLMFAAHEARVKSERWKEALGRRHARGLPKNGLLRYGYVSQGKGLPLVQDPDTAPVLAELYRRYAQGAGFQALVMDLNQRGITTRKGGAWGVHSLIRMLDSGYGAGLLYETATKQHHPGVHEPVISKAEWQAYLDARKVRRALPSKVRSPRWALSGIARCGVCGASLAVSSYDETKKKSQVRCTAYVSRRTCTGVWMNRLQLENTVEFWLVGWYQDDLAAVLSTERSDQADRARSHAESLERALTAAQGALSRLAVKYGRDLIDDEAYSAAQGELTRERDRLGDELTSARQEVVRLGPIGNPVDDPGDLSPGEWGVAVGRVLRRVEVTKTSVKFIPVVGDPTTWDR